MIYSRDRSGSRHHPGRLKEQSPLRLENIARHGPSVAIFQLAPGGAPHLFSSLLELKGWARRLSRHPISSEQKIESYERFAVEEQIYNIITELCKIPAARDEFNLGEGIQYNNHKNLLEDEIIDAYTNQSSSVHRPRPDQFCIHRVGDNTTHVLTSIEYKPPHKLSVATLHIGLRPMDLWKYTVRSKKIPTDEEAKLRYNAERLVCSALVQEYHIMIQEGIEYSYVTNGIARFLLRVARNNPETLYYFLYDPNTFQSSIRSQEWRNSVRASVPT
ncbi:hypothetical protein POX_h09866 [Penicillium oxalicum]|uniref:hypothetical protein n=1 Tax=Penicillium oxalicum TaxID=69781 RepID=UPI0020B6A629|nr:hypothetical protein POX_h09866 [Penicillium oxalicum]KAI2786099.1 hypothetical protein POX_h09866 [Penicillium oxalicum]